MDDPSFDSDSFDAKDPLDAVQRILQYNEKVAPVDIVYLGQCLAKAFHGMEGLAKEFWKVYRRTKNEQVKARMLTEAMTMLNKTAELQPSPKTANDLSEPMLASAMKFLATLDSDAPPGHIRPVDTFGA